MADSTRQQIIDAVKARLEAIRQGATFQTDAGYVVYVNESPALGPDDPDTAIAVAIGDDIPQWHGEQVLLTLPMEINAVASDQIRDAWRAVEPVLADIKRAIELEDRFLGGLLKYRLSRHSTRTLPRDEGSTTVGVGITYHFEYAEVWGQP